MTFKGIIHNKLQSGVCMHAISSNDIFKHEQKYPA